MGVGHGGVGGVRLSVAGTTRFLDGSTVTTCRPHMGTTRRTLRGNAYPNGSFLK